METDSSADKSIGSMIQRHRHEQGLTQESLARKADVPYTTLTKVESGAIRNPSMQFVQKVSRALQISIDTLLAPRVYRGDKSIHQIWDDTLLTLAHPGDFMCISGIDESQFLAADRAELLRFISELKKRGLQQKLICCEGSTEFLEGEHLEYRSIAREHFNPTPMYVYGDRVAILTWGPPQQAIILQNQSLADTYRKQFLFIWEHAKPVARRKVKPARTKGAQKKR